MYVFLIFLVVQLLIYISKNEKVIAANEKINDFLKKPIVLLGGTIIVAIFPSEIKQGYMVVENFLCNGFNSSIGLQILVCLCCLYLGTLLSKVFSF